MFLFYNLKNRFKFIYIIFFCVYSIVCKIEGIIYLEDLKNGILVYLILVSK